MRGRMSSRERIEHLRAEAEAAAKEKAAAKAEKAARSPTPRRSSSKAAAEKPRVRIVWLVCDPSGKEWKQFPYAQEQEARAEALRQSTATGRSYFVTQADVPFG